MDVLGHISDVTLSLGDLGLSTSDTLSQVTQPEWIRALFVPQYSTYSTHISALLSQSHLLASSMYHVASAGVCSDHNESQGPGEED